MATVVAQPQGSRAGLITTIVVFVILTVLMTVLYFQKNTELVKTQDDADHLAKKYADVITDVAINSPEYQTAKDQAKTAGIPSVFDLEQTQRADLSRWVAGQPTPSPQVNDLAQAGQTQGNKVLSEYAVKANTTVAPGNSLLEVISRWPAIADKLIEQREQLKKDVAAGADKAKADADAAQKSLAAKDKEIADAKAETAKVQADYQTYQQQASANLAALQKSAADQATAESQKTQQVQGVVAEKDTGIAVRDKKIEKLMSALRRFKQKPGTKEAPIRVPDGEIKTVAGRDCYINLGQGDQISVGMTFEIYDPTKGIPPLNDGLSTPDAPTRRAGPGLAGIGNPLAAKDDDRYQYDLPKGKGSLEVINVGADHTSQCRIVHVEPGQTISQGDLIANLVYDRNTRYNFVVYGDFDLSNSNANVRANDAPVIRRLIEQWGGRVQPIIDPAKPATSVTPDTDFVIVGKEPQLPNLTLEESATPEGQQATDKAKIKQDAYRAVLAEAANFGIPVMNQNRFLYYTGYFDQAKR